MLIALAVRQVALRSKRNVFFSDMSACDVYPFSNIVKQALGATSLSSI